MIVLDTNVLSEALRPAREPSVLDWLANQPRASLFTTTVSQGEILYGIRLLCDGKRRRGLWDAANEIFDEDFADQVLSFDSDAADLYAEIAASRRTAGKLISQFDAMIVSMVRSRGASLASQFRAHEKIGGGYTEVAEGYQREMKALADAIMSALGFASDVPTQSQKADGVKP